MPELAKPAGKRCRHQRALKGCAVYARRPVACRLWSCRWLAHDDTADMRRPDRVHYVIDPIPDFVTVQADGGSADVPVVQVWIGPDFPEAHRDPALRAYLERRAAEGFAALIRSDARNAFVIFAPAMTPDGLWHDTRASVSEVTAQHSVRDIARVLAGG